MLRVGCLDPPTSLVGCGHPIEDVWRPVDDDEAWDPFNARFEFRLNYHEQTQPAIRLPDRCLVVDLRTL